MPKQEIVTFWFRRDLRLKDNAALYHALKSGYQVLPIFIFDSNILNKLEDQTDARVTFIHQQLYLLKKELEEVYQSSLLTEYGDPFKTWEKISKDYTIKAVYTNHDYEPYAIKRDQQLADFFKTKKIGFNSFKDQCVFEKKEVLKDNGEPYVVFTPYKNKWLAKLKPFYYKPYPTEKYGFSNNPRVIFSTPSFPMTTGTPAYKSLTPYSPLRKAAHGNCFFKSFK